MLWRNDDGRLRTYDEEVKSLNFFPSARRPYGIHFIYITYVSRAAVIIFKLKKK